ncbi:adenylate kinase 1 ATP binding protein, partial [Corynespora cassiicola Philippines]
MAVVAPSRCRSGFAIIFVLGAPGAGKGTLSAHLAQKHDILHYSVGDSLRSWMRENRGTDLAAQIQDRLDNQGFLTSKELYPFICGAISEAIIKSKGKCKGVIVDGFPRCVEQLESFDTWVAQDKLPPALGNDGQPRTSTRPDIVLLFEVSEENARARYLGRGRDDNDSREKFERRFAEYRRETLVVEEAYEQRGILLR